MERREIVICDLAEACRESERLSGVTAKDRWEIVRYETAERSGTGIIASPRTMPQQLTLDPGLRGWYRIYLAMAAEDGMNGIELRLDGDDFSEIVRPCDISRHINWNSFEMIEESYWKAADMTGKSLCIMKPEKHFSYTASLMWIRFVPAEEEEVRQDTAAKTMYAHMDEDFMWMDPLDPTNIRDYLRPIRRMRESDVEVIAQEVTNDLCDRISGLKPEESVTRRSRGEDVFDRIRLERARHLTGNREAVIREETEYAHRYGMRFFAAHRMALSNFGFPFSGESNRIGFVAEHPEFSCVSRDGKRLAFLSYAFPEVQDYMIAQLRKTAEYGVDGVTLIFTRGPWIMYEKPVRDLFAERYGEAADLRRLPSGDRRACEIRCAVMTGFMRRLRGEMDSVGKRRGKRVEIYVTSYTAAEDIQKDGLDVETLAREGLIDGVIQSNMTVWEETDDVLGEDGRIDLEKYRKKAESRFIVKRAHANEIERILRGLPTYRRIAGTYGIRLWSEIQWENSAEPEDYAADAKRIYENGGTGIALWDAYPKRVTRLSEWYVTSRLGSPEHIGELNRGNTPYRRLIKILSWNGEDMSLYNPSWRG